jgi:periplasmic protein CpxP/Spy
MSKVLSSMLLSAGLALAAGPSLAQDATPAAKEPRAAQPSQRQARALPSERVESRITELKSALKITSAQEPQWNAFADTLRKQARAGDDRVKQHRVRADKDAKPAPATAIQRLEQRQAFMKEASVRMDELLATARPLYAALSPEQQKTADALMARHGRGGRDGHREHGGPRPTKG